MSENKTEKQKEEFKIFLQKRGVKKSFKQYSRVIEYKMCREHYKTENITKYKNLFECTDPKEFDEIMPKLLENPKFLEDMENPNKGTFSDHRNTMKHYSSFLHERMIVIDDVEQEKIQLSEPATSEELQSAPNRELKFAPGGPGKVVMKNERISKSALERKNYICQINPEHKTFQTTRGVPYMEGHHIIPCTATNAEYFMNQNGKHIDCLENIICICPICHRAIHFGDKQTKKILVRNMYAQQSEQLTQIGITITEEILLELYKC